MEPIKKILKRTLIKHQWFLCTPPPPPTHTLLFPNSRAIWSQTASSVMPALHNAHAGDRTFVLFPSTVLSLHHSSPLQVIPKQNLSVREPLRPGILTASSRPALLSRSPSSYPKSPPLCPPSPGLKRCLSIFNGAIVLLCVSEWGSIGRESVLYPWAGLAWIGEGINSNSWAAGPEEVTGRRCGGD